MVALTTQLSKKASREKMAAVSEEKKILELLIGKCEDCILELKDSCQHASSNTDLWHTLKIFSFF